MAMAAMCRPGMMVMMMTTSTPTSFSSTPNCNALPVLRPCAGLRIDLRSAISQNHRNEILQQQIRSLGGKRRRRSSRSVVRAGLPVVSSIPVVGPLANAIFNPVLLFIVYAAGGKLFQSPTMRFVHLKQFWMWLSSWNPEPNGYEFGILNSSHMEANKGSDQLWIKHVLMHLVVSSTFSSSLPMHNPCSKFYKAAPRTSVSLEFVFNLEN